MKKLPASTTLERRKRNERTHGVRVKRSRAGLGLFTEHARKKDELIVEYTGERISDEEADRRDGSYIFTIRKNLCIDGRGREHIARYINHSCRPNCYAEIDEEKGRIYIRAKRAIAPGEELSYHYGPGYFKDHIKPYGCRCEKCAAR